MQGQCIDLPPDSAPLPRWRPACQLWLTSGLFLLWLTDLFDGGVGQQLTVDDLHERGAHGAADQVLLRRL